MQTVDWIRLHLALEQVGLDDGGQLYRLPGPDPDTLHRVYVCQHAQGVSYFYRQDLSEPLRAALRALPVSAFFDEPERVRATLAVDGPCEEVHIGKSYWFPPDLPPSPDVTPISRVDPRLVQAFDAGLAASGKEAFAVLADGQVVCVCESSREDARAGEAWVRTLDAYRGRGYAGQATSAWARWLMQQGKTPFYSHRIENTASQKVAERLGLAWYITDAGYA